MSTTHPTRKQCNVRLPPALIAAADARRAALGLSRDRYIERLILADTSHAEPSEELLAEAAALAAKIRGNSDADDA